MPVEDMPGSRGPASGEASAFAWTAFVVCSGAATGVGERLMARPIRITCIRPTPATVPLEAPLRHANGCHWGRFVRTIVEVETDAGITGLGEIGGDGESAEAVFKGPERHLVSYDPFRLEAGGNRRRRRSRAIGRPS